MSESARGGEWESGRRPDLISPPPPLRCHAAGYGTRRARSAGAAVLGILGAAAGAAAGDERIGKLAELHLGLIDLGQFAGDFVQLGRRVAEKIEQQRLSVEQVFDIDENGWDLPLEGAHVRSSIGPFPVPPT